MHANIDNRKPQHDLRNSPLYRVPFFRDLQQPVFDRDRNHKIYIYND